MNLKKKKNTMKELRKSGENKWKTARNRVTLRLVIE